MCMLYTGYDRKVAEWLKHAQRHRIIRFKKSDALTG